MPFASQADHFNGGRTPLGARDTGGIPFQVSANGTLPDGTEANRLGFHIPSVEGRVVDDDPVTWQKVRIPLRRLIAPDATSLTAVAVQYRILPDRRAGLLVRGFRLERRE